MPTRAARAHWEGSLVDGGGTMALGSGAYEGPYSYKSRFEEGTGTNPEELIGAAHAGCFSMALSLELAEAGHPPDAIDTDAKVTFVKDEERGGFKISRIQLATRGRVPGMDAEAFQRAAESAKENCPVSKLLAPGTDITLDARLES